MRRSATRGCRSGTLLIVLAVVGSTAACSIGDVRRPPPSAAPPSAAPPSPRARPTPAQPDEIRQVRVPVPRDFGQSVVQFVDGEQGYAQFTRCGGPGPTPAPDCTSILLATDDGGRSWQQLRHPRPLAKNHQLYADAGSLVLLAEPHGWYVSGDAGRTFRHEPVRAEPPAAVRALNGRFQLCCDGDSEPQVGEWIEGRFRPVPGQRPIRALGVMAYDGDRLFVAGVRDGRAEASWSHDEGATWWATAVSESDGALSAVQLAVGGGDAWLIGHRADRTMFPQLWRAQGDRWEAVAVPGHAQRFSSAVSLGAGLLAVIGPDGTGVVTAGDHGGRYDHLNWPVRNAYLQLLPNGTLFADGSDGTAWLGPGVFGKRRWIKLVLERT